MCQPNTTCIQNNSTDSATTILSCCFDTVVSETFDTISCRDCDNPTTTTTTDSTTVTIIIILAVVVAVVAFGLAVLVYRVVQKPVTRAEIRKLYSIDVDGDSFIGDDLERSLIDPRSIHGNGINEKGYVIANVSTNSIDGSVIYMKKSCHDYDSFGEGT